jgi:hypothetical protein
MDLGLLLDPVNTFNFPDLFTLLWVGAILIVVGATFVYSAAGRRYRRYPALMAMHEWLFWSIVVTWGPCRCSSSSMSRSCSCCSW